jgi:dephospho-CoA kinase
MIIIGITGTLGAGKGAIVEYLAGKRGFKHYSARQFIAEEVGKRALPINRDTITLVANELRTNNSPSYIVEELYKRAVILGENCIIESIRTEGEVVALRNKGSFYLFAVDANPKTRYERVVLRKSETDSVSYEKFLEDEQREFSSEDPNKQNLSRCIALADYVFNNDRDFSSLYAQVDKTLEAILGE